MASQSNNLLLGIDGGGTRTRAALVDHTGTLRGFGVAGPSNYQSVGIETAGRNIIEAVNAARAQAGVGTEPAEAAFLGMAGVASEDDRGRIAGVAGQAGLALRTGVDHDIRTALSGGLAGKPGIALIAGTGSSCYGRRADGVSWRSGGWGHIIDDAGGGYWLGVQGLMAITRAFDGRGEATALAAPMMERLGIESMDAVVHHIGRPGISRAEIADLAPLVLRTASYGDRVARTIVTRGADELARMAEAITIRLSWDGPAPVMTTGGLTTDTLYAEAIRRALLRRAPRTQLTPAILPPVFGAIILAMELAEIPVTAGIINKMREESEKKV